MNYKSLTVTAEIFIWAIRTVLFAITGIADVDTAAVIAHELVRWAMMSAYCRQKCRTEHGGFGCIHTHKSTVIHREGEKVQVMSLGIWTFCVVFRCQHSDGDVIWAPLSYGISDSHLESIDTLSEPTQLQQTRVGNLWKHQTHLLIEESFSQEELE